MTNTDIYSIFDEFLKTTVIEKKNMFSAKDSDFLEIFTTDHLKELVAQYVNNPIDGQKAKEIFDSNNISFEDRIRKQFENGNVSKDAKAVFGHLMWLQYLPAIKPGRDEVWGKSKCEKIERCTELQVSYSSNGVAGYGMAAMRLDDELTDLVLLFHNLVQENWGDLEKIKKYIVKWCLDIDDIRSLEYEKNANGKRKCPVELLPIHNMLLHLCKKEHYYSIAVSGHKRKIVDTFECLIPQKTNEENCDLSLADDVLDNDCEYNKKIFIIVDKLKKGDVVMGNNALNEIVDFYDDEYKNLWDAGSDKDYSDINAIKFKKAIILYGPPGTSKTFSAEGLAKTLIFRLDYSGSPDKVEGFLADSNKIKKNQIHRLQLHPNYAYEDFVWGYQIENGQTLAKKGYFLKLIDKVSRENEETHVLILDEINRVDLSRLFGELFSSIENRGKEIDLPVEVEGIKQISVPNNLYIIGTMNEIDFSLERVDFALRRRFAWFFYGYNEDKLSGILNDKLKKNPISTFDDNAQNDYIQCCSLLNKSIDKDPELGPQYQIGHTFFAELVDIWKDMPRKGIKNVKTILWNISIGPMIEAYLGNCDKDTKENKIAEYKTIFGIDNK